MSRYLEIDSTYRNREQYPNPSNFTVLIAQSGTRDAAHAYDPVSLSAPEKTWSPNDLIHSGGTVSSNFNNKFEFIANFNTDQPKTESDYYVGSTITVNGVYTQITSWNLISQNDSDSWFTVTVFPEIDNIPNPSESVIFEQKTDFTTGAVFVPNGFLANNYYVGSILYNETKQDYRTILSYDGTHKMIGLDLSTKAGGIITSVGADDWLDSHVFSIRKSPPKYVGTFPTPPPIPGYNQATSFLLSTDTNVSVGDFIRITGASDNNRTCRITAYTGNGSPAVPANPNSNPPTPLIPEILANIATTNCIMNPVIDVTTSVNYEILQFSRDNAVPFTYTGSLVSQQEMVCYEIRLINLVLPNKILKSGGRVAFYPYVYVELQNVSSGTRNVIYSNNPNSTRMLFRAAIDDIPNPLISPFVKIDGDGMVQTVKFKPNDNFKFGVYLPNGEELETIYTDDFSPAPANPLLQVSALFSMKRL
jgi:hypothetical protein